MIRLETNSQKMDFLNSHTFGNFKPLTSKNSWDSEEAIIEMSKTGWMLLQQNLEGSFSFKCLKGHEQIPTK